MEVWSTGAKSGLETESFNIVPHRHTHKRRHTDTKTSNLVHSQGHSAQGMLMEGVHVLLGECRLPAQWFHNPSVTVTMHNHKDNSDGGLGAS